MDVKRKTLLEIITFLVLTTAFSALVYVQIRQAGTISGDLTVLAALLMASPGLAAVITYLAFERSLRPVGWKSGKLTYWLVALVIPLVYCLLAYGLAWAGGWGKFNGQVPPNVVVTLVVLLVSGTFSALLEEVGWRGLLVPKMLSVMAFAPTALVSGIIWAVWHYPLIIFTDVRPGDTSLIYSLVCFTLFVIGFSFAAAWLRAKTGSVWPAAVLHGSHNAFMLSVFNVLTTDTGPTWRLLGEYGAATAVIGLVLAAVFWGLRTRLPEARAVGQDAVQQPARAGSTGGQTAV